MIEEHEDEKARIEHIRSMVDQFIIVLSRLFSVGVLMKISGCVGVADLEEAYAQTLQQLGENNATRLIDLTIKLEHSGGFPEADVRKLHKSFSKSPFADLILKDLVLVHMEKFELDRKIRQSIAALLEIKANAASLIDPTRKRR